MKKVPKPSELLQRSLDLLGPKGENWITGEEHDFLEAGFICDGERLDEENAIERMIDRLADAIRDNKGIVKTARELEKAFKRVEEQDAFCAIGAVKHINTSNEQKATIYLAKAIDPRFEEGEDAEGTITTFNDNQAHWIPVRDAFRKAIKLAKKDGN